MPIRTFEKVLEHLMYCIIICFSATVGNLFLELWMDLHTYDNKNKTVLHILYKYNREPE